MQPLSPCVSTRQSEALFHHKVFWQEMFTLLRDKYLDIKLILIKNSFGSS